MNLGATVHGHGGWQLYLELGDRRVEAGPVSGATGPHYVRLLGTDGREIARKVGVVSVADAVETALAWLAGLGVDVPDRDRTRALRIAYGLDGRPDDPPAAVAAPRGPASSGSGG